MTEKRTRNAAATRAAILGSARAAFVRSGYDGAGLREIAETAGVTAMMVNRYFGSKQLLFAEVLEAERIRIRKPSSAVAPGVVTETRASAMRRARSGARRFSGVAMIGSALAASSTSAKSNCFEPK